MDKLRPLQVQQSRAELKPVVLSRKRKIGTESEHDKQNDYHSRLLQEAISRLSAILWHESWPLPQADKATAQQLRAIIQSAGLRVTLMQQPGCEEESLVIYTDSCLSRKAHENELFEFFVTLLGLHPRQDDLEHWFKSSFQENYCLWLFCRCLSSQCPGLDLSHVQQYCTTASATFHTQKQTDIVYQMALEANDRWVLLELEQELNAITKSNCTLSNALLQRLRETHQVSGMILRQGQPAYERIVLSFVKSSKQPLVLLPSLSILVKKGTNAVVDQMVKTFWDSLWEQGYYVSQRLKCGLETELRKYFHSGLITKTDPSLPLQLWVLLVVVRLNGLPINCHSPLLFHRSAHFTPTYHLAFYLNGPAGSGKSSLSRYFGPALQTAIARHAHSRATVHSIQQTLNKSLDTLKLELDVRPNNNDMSLMSIVQSRQLTRRGEPGLVVLHLEEMPADQQAVVNLVSGSFGGQNGASCSKQRAARSSVSPPKCISKDPTVVPIVTSNYELHGEAGQQLSSLSMFQNLKSVHLIAIVGAERRRFATLYLQRYLVQLLPKPCSNCHIWVESVSEEGDCRRLVQTLRVIGFYVKQHLDHAIATAEDSSPDQVAIKLTESSKYHVQVGAKSFILTESNGILRASSENSWILDQRVRALMSSLHGRNMAVENALSELGLVLQFWISHTLSPAVVVSTNAAFVEALVTAVGSIQNDNSIRSILGVDASSYRMSKTLYDHEDTPNLRNDLARLGCDSLVFVELSCPDAASQFLVRNLLEDSPSRTAFSTNDSALKKSGMLFIVHCNGAISPEVRSRASIVLE